jgi:hypothetical protein
MGMLESRQVEDLIRLVSAMDRETIVGKCVGFDGAFPVDFTPEFLARLPIDKLRHIFVALCIQNSHVPVDEAATAA